MRAMALLGVALSVTIVSQPAVAADALQAFEFKGVTAGQPVDLDSLDRCRTLKDATVECSPANPTIAGKVRGDGPRLGFVDSHLVYVKYKFDGADTRTLVEMLEAKYGFARNDDADWRAGKAAQELLSWRFQTGELLVSIDTKSGGGELRYTDTYKPPRPDVIPDF